VRCGSPCQPRRLHAPRCTVQARARAAAGAQHDQAASGVQGRARVVRGGLPPRPRQGLRRQPPARAARGRAARGRHVPRIGAGAPRFGLAGPVGLRVPATDSDAAGLSGWAPRHAGRATSGVPWLRPLRARSCGLHPERRSSCLPAPSGLLEQRRLLGGSLAACASVGRRPACRALRSPWGTSRAVGAAGQHGCARSRAWRGA